jgi:hypothetical protein
MHTNPGDKHPKAKGTGTDHSYDRCLSPSVFIL